jgi:citrate synthase
MAMLTSALAALSSFYPKAKDIHDPEQRYISIIRLLSKTPTIAAMIYRHMKGLPVVYPDNSLPYVENYLSMVARMGEPRYEANPAFSGRSTCCSSCTPTTSRTARRARCARWARRTSTRSRRWRRASAALYGPLHGGANEAVLRMIEEIGHPSRVPAFLDEVKSGKGSRLMGFGHRVYKNYDPRARIVKQLATRCSRRSGWTRTSRSRSSSRRRRSTTSTSSAASSTPTSTSTRG